MATEESTAIDVPAPTAWPLVLAMGFTLMFAGLLTNVSVTVLGVVLSLAGCVGWFREVVPGEHEEEVPVVADDAEVTTERRVVDRLAIAPEQVRAWLPVHTYPVSAGVQGGWAGSVAMAVLACGYGLLKAGSIWYPINLLAAVVYAAVGETRTRRTQCVSSRQLRHRRGRARASSPRSWDCSTARCCPCSRGGRSSSADSSSRCCGRDCCTRR